MLRTIEWLIKKRRQRLSYGKISRIFCQRNCKCLDFNQCNDLHLNWTSKNHYSFSGKRKFKSLELELLFLTIKKCRSTLKQQLLQYFTSPPQGFAPHFGNHWLNYTYIHVYYTSSSPKLFSDFSLNHNFKQIQSGLARCPRKDKVSPEQLYFHIKRPLKYSFTRTRHTHTLVTSCDDSVSTLSLNLVP